MRARTLFATVVFATSAAPLAATAQDTTLAKDLNIDVSIPTHPGLAIVGADPSGLTQVSSFSQLGSQLGSYIDGDGKVQPGFSLAVQPYWLDWANITVDDYAASGRGWMRDLARTTISLAGVGSGDDGSRLGIGVHTQLFDEQDPRMDKTLGDCLHEAAQWELWSLLPEEARQGDPPPQRNADQCYKEGAERFLLEPGLIVGAGLAFNSTTGHFSNLSTGALSSWAAYRHPLGPGPGDLTIRALIQIDHEFDVTGGTAKADEASIALVYAHETDGHRWEIVGDYTVRDVQAAPAPATVDDEFLTLGARYLMRVRKGVWAELGYRNVSDNTADEDNRVTFQIKLDLAD